MPDNENYPAFFVPMTL